VGLIVRTYLFRIIGAIVDFIYVYITYLINFPWHIHD